MGQKLEQICENCEFWEKDTSECRRYPPTSNEKWRKSKNIDWCGEFKPKKIPGKTVVRETKW